MFTVLITASITYFILKKKNKVGNSKEDILVEEKEDTSTNNIKIRIKERVEEAVDPIEMAQKNNDLAVEAYNRGDINEAIDLYKKALYLNSKLSVAQYNLGNAFFALEDYDSAIDCFEKFILLQPRDPFAYYNLANAYFKKGDNLAATTYYQKALVISPGDYMTHYNLGKVYEEIEDYSKATLAYKKALEIKPDYDIAHFNLGQIYSFTGKRKEAIQEFELYLKYNPTATDADYVKKKLIELMTR
ncbi:MAG: tetratricopeptide repeat protein [Candidatus Sericytochromatia bacterium]